MDVLAMVVEMWVRVTGYLIALVAEVVGGTGTSSKGRSESTRMSTSGTYVKLRVVRRRRSVGGVTWQVDPRIGMEC